MNNNGSKQSNGNGNFSTTKLQRPKMDRKDMKCRATRHSWRECSTPRQGNNHPFKPTNQNQNTGQNLKQLMGEEM